MFHTGRRLAKRSSALRSPTLTLLNPPPTGVVTGPFSATLVRRIESSSVLGSVSPCRSSASTPARCASQFACSPAASRIVTTAPVTSGPMPSPAISVMSCLAIGSLRSFPVEQDQAPEQVDHHQPRRELVQFVEADAPRIARGQLRGEAADLLLDGVDLGEDGQAR